MRKILCSTLLVTIASLLLYACSSGAYTNNASNVSNGAVNPLNPLTTSQFTWPGVSGIGKFTATINGAPWVADTAYYYLDTGGANIVYAIKYSPRSTFNLYLVNTWQGNLYNMGYKQYNTLCTYGTYDTTAITGAYLSDLGNSGELYMQQNDTAIFMGRFYCLATSSTGQQVNVTDGYFNLHK